MTTYNVKCPKCQHQQSVVWHPIPPSLITPRTAPFAQSRRRCVVCKDEYLVEFPLREIPAQVNARISRVPTHPLVVCRYYNDSAQNVGAFDSGGLEF